MLPPCVMAADVGKVFPTDLHLLRRELELQGELLSQERVERRAEIDRLKLELVALKQLFERLAPGFTVEFNRFHARARQSQNPEFGRS